jgi:hypothetical protein
MDTANLDLIAAQRNMETAMLAPDPVAALRACRALQELIAAEVDARAFDARQQGATWTDIGSALDMTKQAAQQRFGD